MNLRGIYTVNKNNKKIIAYNSIQQDGFQLLQNWFVSNNNSDIKRINLFDENVPINISEHAMGTNGISNATDIFNFYRGIGYAVNKENNSYFQIEFDTDRNIKAIGIDVIQTSSLNSNGNIKISYVQNNSSLKQHDNFLIPVMYKNPNEYSKISIGSQNKIYYFDKSINMKRLRIDFNYFNTAKLSYRIYSIDIYEQKQQYLPPMYMTLYDESNNILKTKEIEYRGIPEEGGNSIIYKMCLQQGDLDTRAGVKYVSTDFEMNNIRYIFSKAEFSDVWYQQNLQTVQIQYQLTLSNNT